jgi:hypothetical protein
LRAKTGRVRRQDAFLKMRLTQIPPNLKETAMTQLITFCMSMLVMGAAHAEEIHDAPIPEPNYLGIAVFLLLFVGGSVWYIWRVMRQDKKAKLDKQLRAK